MKKKNELVEQYLDTVTLIADFWIATKDKEIKSFQNEGIFVKKSDIYLNKYHINILVKTEHFLQLNELEDGWKKRFPKAVITKGNQRVESYELRFIKSMEKEENTLLEFVGELF